MVWSDALGARELAGLIVPVVRVGNQQLSSLDEPRKFNVPSEDHH